MSKGKLFVISGASGVGKSTVLARVMAQRDDLLFSVSATTRPPRPGEQEAVNYYFVTHEKFRDMIDHDEFLEYDDHMGNFYGTPKGQLEEKLTRGHVILDIEPVGAFNVRATRPDAVLIFIAPPSLQELENRLRGRGTEAPEVVALRLEQARNECASMEDYDYIVVNDQLDDAIEDLAAILRASRCRSDMVDFRLG